MVESQLDSSCKAAVQVVGDVWNGVVDVVADRMGGEND